MHTPISTMEAAAEGLDSLAAHDATFASIVLDANNGSTLVLTILKDSPRVDFRLLAVQLAELSEKEFRNLQVRYALAGHALKPERVNDFATPDFINLRRRLVLFQSSSFALVVG